jgi:VanZ family protein
VKKVIFNRSPLLALLWALLIFGLCATPGRYIPSASWLELLSFDKWVHAGMFFVLSSLLILSAAKNGWGMLPVLAGIALCISYGGLLELMQAKCFSNRSADWQDFAANTFGCLMALAFSRRLRETFVPAG